MSQITSIANNAAKTHDVNRTKAMKEIASGKKTLGGAESAVDSKLTSTIRSLGAATSNAQRALSFGQIADSGLKEMAASVIRLKEIAVSASADTFDATDRAKSQLEVAELLKSIDKIVSTARFGDTGLLDGTGGDSGVFKFQVGEKAGDEIQLDLSAKYDAATLGIDGMTVETYDDAQTAIGLCDTALGLINDGRSAAGAFLAGMETTINFNQAKSENLESASGVLSETDLADAMSKSTDADIKNQAAQSMAAKSMQQAQNVLNLLR